MPHGPLTPLGRQLLSVLATLRPSYTHARTPTTPIFPSVPFGASSQTRGYHASTPPRSAVAAAAASADELDTTQQHTQPPTQEITTTACRAHATRARRLRKRFRVNRITEVLQPAGRSNIVPHASRGKLDISHVDVGSRSGRREHGVNARRHKSDCSPDHAKSTELRLERIVANYIRHRAAVEQPGQAEQARPFRLRQDEAEYLKAKGHNLGDLQVWADIVSTPDAHDAAKMMAARTATHGLHSVPLFVLAYILRRPHVSARALRVLVQATIERLQNSHRVDQSAEIDEFNRFILFVRLLRHARQVWPGTIPSLPAILLQPFQKGDNKSEANSLDRTRRLTHMLNKAMRLIAIPSPSATFKTNVYHETALVHILRFMSEHNPPLQINREGYRAVILVQLGQKKTATERQWAELKALSWPPWKEERTAMDADITLELHGASKAGETLRRLQEAGYAPREWERVAAIYAGWDTDRTPTIQTLVNLGTAGKRFRSDAAAWIARITATRTAQEAWACFLAYEGENLPRNQDVFLAVFRKLYQEGVRVRDSGKIKERLAFRRVYPGDSKEVEPLPPSTHLYTYTRTSPPTVETFYHQLVDSGVVFEGHCLAFLVSTAASLRLGFQYLLASVERYPSIRSVLGVDDPTTTVVSDLPAPLFTATIELLARFSKAPVSLALRERRRSSSPRPGLLDGKRLNVDHALVYAIELLKLRRVPSSSFDKIAWNAVLNALGNESSLANMHSVVVTTTSEPARMHMVTPEMRKWEGAIVAYWLAQKVLHLMAERHLELDAAGFLALCQVVENVAVGSWVVMRDGRGEGEPYVGRVWGFVKKECAELLKREFRLLVGTDDDDDDVDGDTKMQWTMVFLEVPNPAVMHAYIRALGWLADYTLLLGLVHWMVRHRVELAERRGRDRNGEIVMRRAVVAMRVFTERSWLVSAADCGRVNDGDAEKEGDVPGVEAGEMAMARELRRLKTPAPDAVVDEMRALVEKVEDWGGWPSEEEVEGYCDDGRFRMFLGE